MNRKPDSHRPGRPRGHRASALAVALLVTAFWASTPGALPASARAGQPVNYLDVATEAYVYGYPLVSVEYTRMDTPVPGAPGPSNFFFHKRRPIGAGETTVVRPNNDTLVSTAFLDLTEGPIVLHVPDVPDRYYIMQIMDAWTNTFASPSTTSFGSAAQDFLIVGPDWRGPLPRPATVFRSPTNMVWIIGRTQVKGGDADLEAVHSIQNQYTLTQLNGSYVPTPPACAPLVPGNQVPQQVAALTGVEFFQALSCLMKANPAAPWDMPALKRFEAIGFVPGEDYVPPTDEIRDAVNAAPARAVAEMTARWNAQGEPVNEWRYVLEDIGTYGTNYLMRGAVAWGGLGANLPEDAVYPTTYKDSCHLQLNGAHSYTITFQPGQWPPADGFWSITLYNNANYLVENSIQRYAIHGTDPLVAEDGVLVIYVQPNPPSDPAKQANWLPTPTLDYADCSGFPTVDECLNFNLSLRIYGPQPSVLKGKWQPPWVVREDCPQP